MRQILKNEIFDWSYKKLRLMTNQNRISSFTELKFPQKKNFTPKWICSVTIFKKTIFNHAKLPYSLKMLDMEKSKILKSGSFLFFFRGLHAQQNYEHFHPFRERFHYPIFQNEWQISNIFDKTLSLILILSKLFFKKTYLIDKKMKCHQKYFVFSSVT